MYRHRTQKSITHYDDALWIFRVTGGQYHLYKVDPNDLARTDGGFGDQGALDSDFADYSLRNLTAYDNALWTIGWETSTNPDELRLIKIDPTDPDNISGGFGDQGQIPDTTGNSGIVVYGLAAYDDALWFVNSDNHLIKVDPTDPDNISSGFGDQGEIFSASGTFHRADVHCH